MTMGYGCSSLVHKSETLAREVMLESYADKQTFEMAQYEFFGANTDQSTESGIVDCPNIIGDLDAVEK